MFSRRIIIYYIILFFLTISCVFSDTVDQFNLSPSTASVLADSQLKLQNSGTVDNPIKIVFVMPRSEKQQEKPSRYPVGLMSLASCLRNKSFLYKLCQKLPELEYIQPSALPSIDVKIVDLQAENENFDLEGYLSKYNPDIVGVSSVTPLFDHALTIAEKVKKVIPEAIRLVGGVHISALTDSPDDLKKTLLLSEFDGAVIKEGEEVLSQMILNLINTKDIRNIPGLILKTDTSFSKKIKQSRKKSYLKLDEYPFPSNALDLLNKEGYLQTNLYKEGGDNEMIGALFTTRGCFGKCTFCASDATLNRPGRIKIRSAENVFAEIQDYVNQGINSFYILDDNFCINTKRLLKLAQLVKEHNLKISIKAMARADSITSETLQALKDLGCYCLALGFETGDQVLLDDLKKGLDLKKLEKATKLVKEFGMKAQYFVMVGLPNQDWVSIKKTAQFLIKNRPDSANVSIAIPYPGTQLYKEGNIIFDTDKTGYEIFRHEPDPGKKDEIFLSNTYTKAMTKKEITSSRDLLMDLIKCIQDKNESQIQNIMQVIDKLIRENSLESTKSFLYMSIFKAA